MEKVKKIARITLYTGIIIFLLLSLPRIENRTWVLSYAKKIEAPYSVVVHGKDFNVSNSDDPIFKFSKPIELICEAKGGKLVLTDKTNGKTYEGTYQRDYGRFGKFRVFAKESYTVVIDGIEGTANFSTNRTLFVSIGGYSLNFDTQ